MKITCGGEVGDEAEPSKAPAKVNSALILVLSGIFDRNLGEGALKIYASTVIFFIALRLVVTVIVQCVGEHMR